MSQPAVSGALARLRVQFDDALLIRDSKDFQLTARALEIMPLVQEAMVEINRTYALVPDFDPLTSQRTFHISSTDYLLSQIAAPLKRLMSVAAPGATLEFSTLTAELDISLIDLVRRDVLVASQDLRMPGKRAKIFDEQLVCVTRVGHPGVKNGKLSLEDLAKAEFVQMVIGKRGTNQVDNALADLGITEQSGVAVRSVMAIPALVSESNMISWLPRRLFNDYQESMNLQIVQTPIPVIEFEESVHWHPSKNSDPAIQWLISSLKEAGSRI
jgi:DNA-binding transcriptional LysR family regulator